MRSTRSCCTARTLTLILVTIALGACAGGPGTAVSTDVVAADTPGDASPWGDGAGADGSVDAVGDLGAEDVGTLDVPASDLPLDIPGEDLPPGDIPLEDIPLEDIPADDVPIDDVPVDDVPVADLPPGDLLDDGVDPVDVPPPPCENEEQDPGETGVDCGGDCGPCPVGEGCATDGDCVEGVCADGICAEAACDDGVTNGDETDEDCGGDCPPCAPGDACLEDEDCADGAPVCDDPGTCQGTRPGGICADTVCAIGPALDDDTACDDAVVADACGPYPAVLCDGGGDQIAGTCASVCAVDGDCDPEAFCGESQCQPDLDAGAPCDGPGACLSGHCQNGYCCASGDCCALPEHCPEGWATPPACDDAVTCQGHRVDATCEDATCGSSGDIEDDSGCGVDVVADVCGLYPAQSCTGETVQEAPVCADACAGSDACAPGAYCEAGTCQEVPGLGAACGGDGQCADGLSCVDGVCCGEPCEGACLRCDLPDLLGLCSPAPAGDDPDEECGEVSCAAWYGGWAGSTCHGTLPVPGGLAACTGAGACEGPEALCPDAPQGPGLLTCDETCQAPAEGTCTGTTPGTCDDLDGITCGPCMTCAGGACVPIGAGADPFGDCPGDGACAGTCDGAGECSWPGLDAACDTCRSCDGAGACVPVDPDADPFEDCAGVGVCGGTCDGSGACQFPEDGLTCGACLECDGAGACAPADAGADPFGDCNGDGTCGGTCDGAGGCQFPADGIACGSCMICDGGGDCVAAAAATDPHGDCGGEGDCAGSCDGAGQCAWPAGDAACDLCKRCDGAGACVPVAADVDPFAHCAGEGTCGGSCDGSGECQFPGAGLTCDDCQICDGGGACVPVDSGLDPFDECAGDGPCGGTCDGSGACDFPVLGVQCGACLGCDGAGECVALDAGDDPYDDCNGDGTCGGDCDGSGGCQFPGDGLQCGDCMVCDGLGDCGAVGAGDDPFEECSGEGTCGGTCDGSGGCQYPTSGLQCGECQVCDGLGACDNVGAGDDPFDDCNGDGTCGGTCDGGGTCQFPESGLECGSCLACDGAGNCSLVEAGTDPFEHCAGSGVCGATCDADGGCQFPEAGIDCGPCQECNGLGACAPHPAGTDPDNECPGTGTCGGTCDGSDGCQFPSGGLVCGACKACDGAGACAFAEAGTDPFEDCVGGGTCGGTCDGDGGCQFPAAGLECGPCEVCDGLGGCIPANAGTDPFDDCAGTGLCGGTCDGSGDCQYPTTGLDCGTCMACDGSGACVAAPAATDPHGDCTGAGVCAGTCDGAGACAWPGSVQSCGACLRCNGAGACVDVGAGEDPFDDCLDSGGCGSVCDGDGGCESPQAGQQCGPCMACDAVGGCVPVAAGADPYGDCTGDAGCAGACDGAGACQFPAAGTSCGDCEICDGAGDCGFVASGDDPAGECGAVACDAWYWGWEGSACHHPADVPAAEAGCNGAGACLSAADLCPGQGPGPVAATCAPCHGPVAGSCTGTVPHECVLLQGALDLDQQLESSSWYASVAAVQRYQTITVGKTGVLESIEIYMSFTGQIGFTIRDGAGTSGPLLGTVETGEVPGGGWHTFTPTPFVVMENQTISLVFEPVSDPALVTIGSGYAGGKLLYLLQGQWGENGDLYFRTHVRTATSCGGCSHCVQGSCTLLREGIDPFEECGDHDTCRGACDGAGTCGDFVAGGIWCELCETCDGGGDCVPVAEDTDPFADCGTDPVCGGTCGPDGACKDTAADGTQCATCQQCDGEGFCVPVAEDTDPYDDCGGVECAGYYWGWQGDTCYAALGTLDDAAVTCTGAGTCKGPAEACPDAVQGEAGTQCPAPCLGNDLDTCTGTIPGACTPRVGTKPLHLDTQNDDYYTVCYCAYATPASWQTMVIEHDGFLRRFMVHGRRNASSTGSIGTAKVYDGFGLSGPLLTTGTGTWNGTNNIAKYNPVNLDPPVRVRAGQKITLWLPGNLFLHAPCGNYPQGKFYQSGGAPPGCGDADLMFKSYIEYDIGCGGDCEFCSAEGPCGPADDAGDTCAAMEDAGALEDGDKITYYGRIEPDATEDWVQVHFPAASRPGVGTPKVELTLNDGDAFAFDVRKGSCASDPVCLGDTLWEFVDNASAAGSGAYSTNNTPWPTDVYLRVYRTGGSGCADYGLTITR